jgi:DNA-directed RNA polymerase specialized sigma24 family protein
MDLDYARLRLEQWGDWARENPVKGLGYPHQSPEHRIFFDKSAVRYEPEDLEAEEVDQIVRQMMPLLREMVIYYFVRRYSTRKIADAMGINRKTVEKRLEVAAGFVAGRLLITV